MTAQRTTAHLISHTHWDREWYMSYERHHVRLIELMDTLLDTFDLDPDYRTFFLDGQTIILDDYLQVRPERAEQLARHIREGRLIIGPWYILQDEFLTSSEANVRNLQIGHQDAARYGSVVAKIGYFPDSFGNIGQAPQLFAQAGIDNAFFGRGVKPTGFNNQVSESASFESPYSEMMWQAPDGSSVLGILFANWYNNGMEAPVDPEEARSYWAKRLADARRFASTPYLLFMNGCDHQPVQTDLPAALETARALHPDVDFVHGTFEDYLRAVRESLPDDLVTIQGELRSQRTDGWGTLVNTASSRIYLKQQNQHGQALLERGAEPLAAFAKLGAGRAYPHHLLTYAWKTLMQNHPHDSICGCSVDEVHREMSTRFAKSAEVAGAIIDDSLAAIASAIDTASVPVWADGGAAITVFNTSGWSRSGVMERELEVARIYFGVNPSLPDIIAELAALPVRIEGSRLLDEQGGVIPARVEDLGVHFGYELPRDRFRQPYMARTIRVVFEAVDVPALGYRTYAWEPGAEGTPNATPGTEVEREAGLDRESAPLAAGAAGDRATGQFAVNEISVREGVPLASALLAASANAGDADAAAPSRSLLNGPRGMANDYVSVTVREDGSFDLIDRASGQTYAGLGIYEDCGDIGNEYVFRQPDGEVPLTTAGHAASIRIIEDVPYRAVFEIVHEWALPRGAEAAFEAEKRKLIYVPERASRRADEAVACRIATRLSLEAHGRGVRIQSEIVNEAKDHRIRMLFPAGIQAGHHWADSIFEVARRDTEPAEEWINPSNCQHMQTFASVADEYRGLTVAGKGLHEYEVLRDGQGTIALTLLRSVSELGDWGDFPTPEAQCLGVQTAELAVFPHVGGPVESGAYAEAYNLQTPWFTAQPALRQSGALPPIRQWVAWEGAALALTSVKLAAGNDDLMLRWANLSAGPTSLSVAPSFATRRAFASNILEERLTPLEGETAAALPVGPAKIVTLAIEY
ncbi:alpha-mannosidase [Paenibacillus methanolicus]|uniref:Alpha-mannosidase n=1 Tax=Paenibacillus methanolicus TaxID=582686 RepID=A0A5S5BT60_9BACL|nr:alpha-mannosidase [Paenibacillus methanolicus]TYP69496.1 alpha-mannosidase [Paenibacillus methanolicus]